MAYGPLKFPPHRRWEHVPVHAIQAMFRHVFVRWGLPDRVRVDNGYPWGSSRDLPPELALWLIGLGVEPIWNPPAQPTRNPKVERSNGLTSRKKLGKGALDYLQSHPFCKKETLGS